MKLSSNFKKWFLEFSRRIVSSVIFICYSTENLKQAREVVKLVEKYNGIPFIAPYSIEGGKNPKEAIYSNINNCNIFLPLISSKTTKSPFVHQEIGYALSLKKYIIPVIIGNINQKDLGFLSDLQYTNYNSKEFTNLLRRRILTQYLHTILVYTFLLGIILLLKIKSK